MANYVSLFSGAGGLDIGLERAGLNLISMCEIDVVFCQTLKQNMGFVHNDGRQYLKNSKVLNCDIRDISGRELKLGNKSIDVVVGGPPCQAFSSSGKQLSVLDPRGALVSDYIRIIGELKPKMFVFENVRGLVTARDEKGVPGGVITRIVRELEDLGYSCRSSLLNSADYGSHQRRVRCFIVGSSKGEAPFFPEPIYSKDGGLFRPKWLSLRDYLNEFEDRDKENYSFPTKELLKLLNDVKDGSGLKSPGRAETTRPGGHWGYRQGTFIADLDLPARTVTGSASQDWIRWRNVLRRLTLEEVKGLQGFPSDWIVAGNKSQQFKQIGNAVPTVFGELIGLSILEHLQKFPTSPPVKLGIPKKFLGYIDYTKRDEKRNGQSRVVHTKFSS